jgi:hypothetical protein
LRVAHFGLRHGKEPTIISTVVVVVVEEYCREPGKERTTQKSTTVGEIVSMTYIHLVQYLVRACERSELAGPRPKGPAQPLLFYILYLAYYTREKYIIFIYLYIYLYCKE